MVKTADPFLLKICPESIEQIPGSLRVSGSATVEGAATAMSAKTQNPLANASSLIFGRKIQLARLAAGRNSSLFRGGSGRGES